MIYNVLLLMLCTFFKGLFLNSCTFFKGLFALFCHFFKGLSVAKIQNFLLKGKENGNYFLLKGKVFPFSPIITLMQGKPAGNHFGAERDGGGKNQNRKGQDHGALSHDLACCYSIFSYILIASRCKSCICSANHSGERILNWLPRLIKYPKKSTVGRMVISKSI